MAEQTTIQGIRRILRRRLIKAHYIDLNLVARIRRVSGREVGLPYIDPASGATRLSFRNRRSFTTSRQCSTSELPTTRPGSRGATSISGVWRTCGSFAYHRKVRGNRVKLRLFVALLWAVAKAHSAQQLSANEILTRAFENERRQEVIRSQYCWREHAERRESTRDQKPGKLNFTHDYEWIYLEGEPFRKLVAVNGRPLQGKRAKQEALRMQMTAAERRAARANSKPNPRIISVGNVPFADIVRALDHYLVGEEIISGRNAWVIRSAPGGDSAPGAGAADARSCQYTFWIDQQDFVLIRQKYEVVRAGVEALPGTWSETLYSRAADGLWLRTRMEGYFVTGPPRPPARWWQVHTFSDYRKFDAGSTITFESDK